MKHRTWRPGPVASRLATALHVPWLRKPLAPWLRKPLGSRLGTGLVLGGLLAGCGAERAPEQAAGVADPTADLNAGSSSSQDATGTGSAAESGSKSVLKLSPRELLIRASLDLRGIRPSEAEYAAVEADPAAVDTLLDGFLRSAEFPERLRALFAPIYQTRIDAYPIQGSDYGQADDAAFQASVGDEPLRMLSLIAEQDRPYTELVTAAWTMADERLGDAWPVSYPAGEKGWKQVQYLDGRPAAGVLATNGLWWRYPSDGTNYNRGRANALSRIFLCNDYSVRAVEFSGNIDLTDTEAVNDALRTNPGCVNCHSSLDPLASYLFGFQYTAKDSALDATSYHPEREILWRSATGVAPSYYGVPGYGLKELGQQVAADPRFVSCIVQRTYELLLERRAGLADDDALTGHREVFLKGGLTLRPLIRSVLFDPRYRSSEGSSDGTLLKKLVSPELLASQIESLTGYRFTADGYDMLQTDAVGLRSLGGGADGVTGIAPARGPTPAMVLVHERVAEAAAWHVTKADAAIAPESGSTRKLFTEIDFTETPDSGRERMAAQLQALHRRIFGVKVAADGSEVQFALALWDELYAVDRDKLEAWAGVLSLLLRDPDFVLY